MKYIRKPRPSAPDPEMLYVISHARSGCYRSGATFYGIRQGNLIAALLNLAIARMVKPVCLILLFIFTVTRTARGQADPVILASNTCGAIGSDYDPVHRRTVFVEYCGRVSMFDHAAGSYRVLGSGYFQPEDVLLSPDGAEALVTERAGNLLRVSLFNADRTHARTVVAGLLAPQSLARGDDPRVVYTVEYGFGQGRLLMIDTVTGITSTLAAGLDQAVGLVVTKEPKPRFFVTEEAGGGRLVEFSPTATPGTLARTVVAANLGGGIFHLERISDGHFFGVQRDPLNRIIDIVVNGTSASVVTLIDGAPFRPSSVLLVGTQIVVASDGVLSAFSNICGWRAPTTAKSWPNWCWRPYSDASPFNIPIGPNPELLPGQDRMIARVLGDIHDPTWHKPNNFEANKSGNTGEPTYYSRAASVRYPDPTYTIHCQNDPYNRPAGACPVEGVSVSVPAGAQVEGGLLASADNNADRHLTIVDMESGWEYDLWQVKITPLPAGGGVILCSWGGRTRIDGSGLSDTATPFGYLGDATAAHFGSLAGRVRIEEVMAGKIRHALFIDLNCTVGLVSPAAGTGRLCSDIRGRNVSNNDAPPMGARLQLNMTETEINSLPFPEWKKVLLRAAAEYGMFVGDTGASGYFAIETESGNQYSSLGAPDKWVAFAQANQFSYWDPTQSFVGDLNGKLPDGNDIWSRLRIVVTPAP